jgi:hypothetical protein
MKSGITNRDFNFRKSRQIREVRFTGLKNERGKILV